MFGIGSAEAGIIIVVVLLLFAPTVLAFLVGYSMGQRRQAPTGPTGTSAKDKAAVASAPEAVASGPAASDAAAPEAVAAGSDAEGGDAADD